MGGEVFLEWADYTWQPSTVCIVKTDSSSYRFSSDKFFRTHYKNMCVVPIEKKVNQTKSNQIKSQLEAHSHLEVHILCFAVTIANSCMSGEFPYP